MPRPTTQRRELAQQAAYITEVLDETPVVAASEIALVEYLIPHLLDFETRYTDQQLCDLIRRNFEIPFGLEDLIRLQKSASFQERWPLSEYGTDPRVSVAVAMEQLRSLLTSGNTPATVKMRAIERILEMNSVQAHDSRPSSSAELVKFLESVGTGGQLNQLNIGTLIYQTLPQEYRDAADAVNSPTPERNLLGVGSGAQITGGVEEGEFDDVTPPEDD
jgi:hypothetical protein